jgi:hypothetical protein
MRKVKVAAALAGLFVTGLLAAPATAQTSSGLTLTTPYPGLTVEPGDTAGFDLAVTSTTNTTVSLAVDGVPEGWTARPRPPTASTR